MTDLQLLKSIRLRAEKRLSNFLFVKILNSLIDETQYGRLERPIVLQLIDYCNSYNISLDGNDLKHLAINRKKDVDSARRERLSNVGIHKKQFFSF